MSLLDTRIAELLSESDAQLLRASQPHGLAGLIRAMLDGRLRAFVLVVGALQLALAVVAIWAAIRCIGASDALVAVKAGALAVGAGLAALQLLTSFVPHLQAERVIRQLKRVEILLAARRA
ncbi:MAG: hypothetical protein Q8O82_02605 [Pseudorhodobacter sp.]|nr:hypothetical protein [Pseudorhodobacter sp.]